jgi:NADH:ubiquinone oxidoreductase subunit E
LLASLQAGITVRQLNCAARASVCLGHCEKGPNLRVLGQPFRHGVNQVGIEQLLDELDLD